MPFKDPKAAKANKRAYYLKHKEKLKQRATDWYAAHKDHVLKQHQDKAGELAVKNKDWRTENKSHIKKYKKKYEKKNPHLVSGWRTRTGRKARKELKLHYVIHLIKNQTGLSVETIKQHPELIENMRIQLKTKRLLKTKKHGS